MLYYLKKVKRKLSLGIKGSGGRNILGRVCIRGRGCGNKRLYLHVDKFRRICAFCKVLHLIHDSRRSATIGCVRYSNGLIAYIVLTQNNDIGSLLYSGYPAINFDEFIGEG